MTPENKKVLKIIALSAGVILILATIAFLIVKQVQKSREAEEESGVSNSGNSTSSKASTGTSSGASSSSSSTSSFGGRSFSKTDVVKMQAYLMNMGTFAYNDVIVRSIRDSGGLDGKIGTGFKTAYNEAIRIGIIHNLDELYSEALKHS